MAVSFSGVISSTTPDGRSAIVKLNEAVGGKEFAVISPSTRGRIHAMNGVGCLREKQKVEGQADDGIDALDVVSITRVSA